MAYSVLLDSALSLTESIYYGQWWRYAAAGQVTSLASGTGITLSPDPIIATGTVSLTTPVAVANGGTGAATLTGLLRGNGTSAITGAATVTLTSEVSGTLPVSSGGTGITSGTSGGIPYFSGATTMASSGLLTANALVVGGGAGTAPASVGSLGTTTTVLHGNASGAPTFSAVSLTADVSGTLPVANGGTGLVALTQGYIPFGTGTTAFGSTSNLFWDQTNNRLGLLTNSPSRTLDLNGTQRFRGIAAPNVSESNSATIYFDSASNTLKASLNGAAYVNVIGSTGVTGSGVDRKLAFWTGTTSLSYASLLHFSASGLCLGINETTPVFSLDVKGIINVQDGYAYYYDGSDILSRTTNRTLRVGFITPSGNDTIAIGELCLASETGGYNTAIGTESGSNCETGARNVLVGWKTGNTINGGDDNVIIGYDADVDSSGRYRNVVIGSSASASADKAIVIGFEATCAVDNGCVLGDNSTLVGIQNSAPALALDVGGAFGTRHKVISGLTNALNSNIVISGGSWYRVTGPTGTFSIGGFEDAVTGNIDGYHLTIYNTVAYEMTIVNEDASSTAANRIKTLTGSNVVLRSGTSAASFIYDDSDDRWILVSYN